MTIKVFTCTSLLVCILSFINVFSGTTGSKPAKNDSDTKHKLQRSSSHRRTLSTPSTEYSHITKTQSESDIGTALSEHHNSSVKPPTQLPSLTLSAIVKTQRSDESLVRRHSIAEEQPYISTSQLYDESTFTSDQVKSKNIEVLADKLSKLSPRAFGPYIFNYFTLPRVIDTEVIDIYPISKAAVSLYIYCTTITQDFKEVILTYLTVINATFDSLYALFTCKPNEALPQAFSTFTAKTFKNLFDMNNNEIKLYFLYTTQQDFIEDAVSSLRKVLSSGSAPAILLKRIRATTISTIQRFNELFLERQQHDKEVTANLYEDITNLLDYTFDMIIGTHALIERMKELLQTTEQVKKKVLTDEDSQRRASGLAIELRTRKIAMWHTSPTAQGGTARSRIYNNMLATLFNSPRREKSTTINRTLKEKYNSTFPDLVNQSEEYNNDLRYTSHKEAKHLNPWAQFILYSQVLSNYFTEKSSDILVCLNEHCEA